VRGPHTGVFLGGVAWCGMCVRRVRASIYALRTLAHCTYRRVR
jgi:hypothetical protein